MDDQLIIDSHCHAVERGGLQHARISFGTYLRRAAAARIDRSIVFSGFALDYAARNRDIAALVARHPGRLVGFACIDADRDRGRVHDLVEEAARVLGLKGLKVHRKDARLTEEICDAARAFGLPILYDPNGEVDHAASLVAAYPDVEFVIPHLGTFCEAWEAQVAFIEHLVRLPNLLADTSGVRVFDLLAEAVARAGAGKILFGSDGPWLHPGLELDKVLALRLPAAAEGLILGGNAQRLLARGAARRQSPRFARSI